MQSSIHCFLTLTRSYFSVFFDYSHPSAHNSYITFVVITVFPFHASLGFLIFASTGPGTQMWVPGARLPFPSLLSWCRGWGTWDVAALLSDLAPKPCYTTGSGHMASKGVCGCPPALSSASEVLIQPVVGDKQPDRAHVVTKPFPLPSSQSISLFTTISSPVFNK